MHPIKRGSPEWYQRLADLLADQSESVWWWLSFADPARPTGDQFLGVAIVAAPNIVTATHIAGRLGINPGGEVAAWVIPDAHIARVEGYTYRLLSHDDLEAAALEPVELGDGA